MYPSTMNRPVPLSADQQHNLRLRLLIELGKIGRVNAKNLKQLMSGHLDDVLNIAFEYTDMIRVRVTDDEYVCIFPGTTLN